MFPASKPGRGPYLLQTIGPTEPDHHTELAAAVATVVATTLTKIVLQALYK